jgi:hypothetical protein
VLIAVEQGDASRRFAIDRDQEMKGFVQGQSGP